MLACMWRDCLEVTEVRHQETENCNGRCVVCPSGYLSEFLLQGKMDLLSESDCNEAYLALLDGPIPSNVYDFSFCAGSLPTTYGINPCYVSSCENGITENCSNYPHRVFALLWRLMRKWLFISQAKDTFLIQIIT